MKRKCTFIIFVFLFFAFLTGCDYQINNQNNNSASKADHKIYKYVKVVAGDGNELYTNIDSVFGGASEVAHDDIAYKPTLIIEFNTNTGVATKVLFNNFYLDYGNDDWVDGAINAYNESSSELKGKLSNVSKGRVNDYVTYLSAEIDPSSKAFSQFIGTYLVEGQNIDKYKEMIYYSRLDNYDPDPACDEGDNYFEEALEGLRIEWSDNEIKAF